MKLSESAQTHCVKGDLSTQVHLDRGKQFLWGNSMFWFMTHWNSGKIRFAVLFFPLRKIIKYSKCFMFLLNKHCTTIGTYIYCSYKHNFKYVRNLYQQFLYIFSIFGNFLHDKIVFNKIVFNVNTPNTTMDTSQLPTLLFRCNWTKYRPAGRVKAVKHQRCHLPLWCLSIVFWRYAIFKPTCFLWRIHYRKFVIYIYITYCSESRWVSPVLSRT